jgi:cytochrome c556
MIRTGVISIVVASSFAQFAVAQSNSEYELVKLVSERKMLMFDMQTAYLSLLSIKQEGTTDLTSASDDAQLISEKIDAFVELLPPETAMGKVPNSRARAEIWTEPSDFAAAVEALKTAAADLSKVALEADIEAFEVQFDAFSEACFGCHDLKPSSGGRFRSPKQL